MGEGRGRAVPCWVGASCPLRPAYAGAELRFQLQAIRPLQVALRWLTSHPTPSRRLAGKLTNVLRQPHFVLEEARAALRAQLVAVLLQAGDDARGAGRHPRAPLLDVPAVAGLGVGAKWRCRVKHTVIRVRLSVRVWLAQHTALPHRHCLPSLAHLWHAVASAWSKRMSSASCLIWRFTSSRHRRLRIWSRWVCRAGRGGGIQGGAGESTGQRAGVA